MWILSLRFGGMGIELISTPATCPSPPKQASSWSFQRDREPQQNPGQTFLRLSCFESAQGSTVTAWVQSSILTLSWTAERSSKRCPLPLMSWLSDTSVTSVVRKQVVPRSPEPGEIWSCSHSSVFLVNQKKRLTFNPARVLNTLLGWSSPYLTLSNRENILCHTLAPISLTVFLEQGEW